MYKILIISILFAFCIGCGSKHRNSDLIYAGNYVHSKKNKDIMASKEIVLTSLFVATSHIPDIIMSDIFFLHGRGSLSKEARIKIAELAKEIITYEDYWISVEGHEDVSEDQNDSDEYNKLSEKRADSVRRALIRNGIDKDKIESMGAGISKPASKEDTEDAKSRNRRVIIEAELW